jgi:hypothetical protein
MKVDREISDSWSELAFQDLLIDVAAVVVATELDQASYVIDAERAYVASLEISVQSRSEPWE